MNVFNKLIMAIWDFLSCTRTVQSLSLQIMFCFPKAKEENPPSPGMSVTPVMLHPKRIVSKQFDKLLTVKMIWELRIVLIKKLRDY